MAETIQPFPKKMVSCVLPLKYVCFSSWRRLIISHFNIHSHISVALSKREDPLKNKCVQSIIKVIIYSNNIDKISIMKTKMHLVAFERSRTT